MSFAAKRAIKHLKSVVQWLKQMNQPNARKVMKTQCVFFRFLLLWVARVVLRQRQQCLHQKWVGVALAVAVTVN
jgi:hypothetical protein